MDFFLFGGVCVQPKSFFKKGMVNTGPCTTLWRMNVILKVNNEILTFQFRFKVNKMQDKMHLFY